MEKMTNKERETLLALQAKAKRVQRAEEDFYHEVDERRDEILEHFHATDRLQLVASRLDTDTDALFAWLMSGEHALAFHEYLSHGDSPNDSNDPV